MKSRFLVSCLLTLGAGTIVSASFEMLLVPDATTGRIARFDPVNRVQLGSYGPLNTRLVDTAHGSSYSHGSSLRFSIYDYSTGLHERTSSNGFNVSCMAVSNSGTIMLGASTQFRELLSMNDSSSVLRASVTNMVFIEQIEDSGNGYWILAGRNSGNELTFASVNKTTFAVTNSTLALAGNDTSIGALAAHQSGDGNFYFSSAQKVGTTVTIRTFQVASDGLITSVGVSSPITSFFASNTSAVSLAKAHSGFYAVGQSTTAGNTRVMFFNSDNIPVMLDQYDTTAITMSNSLVSIGSVVAPETGTMIALGAGLVALLRRKRQA